MDPAIAAATMPSSAGPLATCKRAFISAVVFLLAALSSGTQAADKSGSSEKIQRELELLRNMRLERSQAGVGRAESPPERLPSESQQEPPEAKKAASLEELLETIRSGDTASAEEAKEALGAMGRPALDPVLGLLEEGEYLVRVRALEILGRLGFREVVPAIVPLVKDASWRVREAATRALGEIADDAGTEGLVEALGDETANVTFAAKRAIERVGTSAVPALIEALVDQNDTRRKRAAEALKLVGDRRAVPALITALEKDENWLVRSLSADALGQLKDLDAVEALENALTDDEAVVRLRAVIALAALGAIGSTERVIETLRDS